MDLNNIFNIFSIGNSFNLLFKIGAIIFAFIFLLYGIVIGRQVTIMNRTLEDKFNHVISLVSSIQIAAAFILLIFSIFLI